MVGEKPTMTWFQSPLVWSRKENYGTSWELQMPLGVPVAAGVLALLALLALACYFLREAWKYSWKLCHKDWTCSQIGKSLQLVSVHCPDQGQLGTLSSEPRGPPLPSPLSF